jgi:HSP20 family protein
MNLIRRDPFDLPLPAMSRLFNQFFEPYGDGGLSQLDEGTLPLDISENERNVIVRASVPGFGKEDIDVEVHNGILTIKAQHNEQRDEKNERFYRRERRFTSMSRRVALPSTVRDDACQAELRDGVLTLMIPKSEEAMPRKVQIREGNGTQTGNPRAGESTAPQHAGQKAQNAPKF